MTSALRWIAVVLFTVFGVAACGHDTNAAAPAPANASTAQGSDGSLFIVQHQTACCYTEGQISFLEVATPAGDIVASRAFAALGSSVAVLDLPIPSGRYHLRSWQRPCDASCPADPRSEVRLDAVTDECTTDVDVAPGERRQRTVQFAPTTGCTFNEGADPVDVPADVTLRPEVEGCGTDFGLDGANQTSAQQCLLDAFGNGTDAEAMSYEPGTDPSRPRFLIRMTTADGVTVFERVDPDVGPWTRTRCGGLALGPDGRVTATDCEAPQQL